MTNPVFCSTIIPTIARPTLTRAVESILDQKFDQADFEAVVVNDTGEPLPHRSWMTSERVHIITTNKRKHVVAQNVGAALARGTYLNFLGDDDWLLPGALEHLWELAQAAPQADWLYGHTQLLDREDNKLLRLQSDLQGNLFIHTMAGEWLPVTSSLVKAIAFYAIGGYNQNCVTSEDMDLARRISLHGDAAVTPHLISAVRMGEAGSSTPRHLRAQSSRKEREKILRQAGVLRRMFASANSNYLYGRIVRLWLTSMIWNLQDGRLIITISRGMSSILSFILTLPHIFSRHYWQAILLPYRNETFIRSFAKDNPAQKKDLN